MSGAAEPPRDVRWPRAEDVSAEGAPAQGADDAAADAPADPETMALPRPGAPDTAGGADAGPDGTDAAEDVSAGQAAADEQDTAQHSEPGGGQDKAGSQPAASRVDAVAAEVDGAARQDSSDADPANAGPAEPGATGDADVDQSDVDESDVDDQAAGVRPEEPDGDSPTAAFPVTESATRKFPAQRPTDRTPPGASGELTEHPEHTEQSAPAGEPVAGTAPEGDPVSVDTTSAAVVDPPEPATAVPAEPTVAFAWPSADEDDSAAASAGNAETVAPQPEATPDDLGADEPPAEVQPRSPLPRDPRASEPVDLFAPVERAGEPEEQDPTLPAQPLPDTRPRRQPDQPTTRTRPVPPPPQQQPSQQQPFAPPVPPARIDRTVRVRPAETTNVMRPIRDSSAQEQTSVMRPVPPAPVRPPNRPTQQPQQRPPSAQRPAAAPAQPTQPLQQKPPPPQQQTPQQQQQPPQQQTPPQQTPAGQRPPAPPRAMPVRIEPERPADEHEDEPVAEPRRRRRGALVAGLGLLLVVAVVAGVLYLVPGAAKQLGLHGIGPGNTTAAPPSPEQVSLALRAATGKEPTPAGVAAALRQVTTDPTLKKLTGKVLDARTGQTLWANGADTPLAPGSTNKLLTAAAALFTLDPTSTLDTKVVAGAQPGSVVIVGGGDPTLSSLPAGQDSVYPGAAHLDQLVAKVKASGVKVRSVSVDLDRYTGDSQAPGWVPADIADGNFTPIVPAMLDGGRNDPSEPDGARTANPAGVLAGEFASRIGATSAGATSAPKNARVLGVVHSAPIADLVENMLRISDNVLAEAVGRQVARATGNDPSFAGAVKAIRQTLSRHGFDLTGVSTADCSGLSTQDTLPAGILTAVLAVAAGNDDGGDTAKLRPMLAGLPVAGGTGTLDDSHGRFAAGAATAAKGYVRAKTGTLSGVSTLAGVVLDSDGRLLVFAMMSNGANPADARPGLDAIAAALYNCGCG